jgi:adenosine deaminase
MSDDVDPGQNKLPLEFFQKLPKTDLHVHLDGSLRLATILDLARTRTSSCPPTTRPGSPRRSTR